MQNKLEFSFILIYFIAVSSIYGQNIFEVFTCDSKINKELKSKEITGIDLIRYEISDDGVTIDPRLPADWHWIAGKNFQGKKGRIDFFLWNGYFFSNSDEVKYVSYRSRAFPDLFTDKIEANTFVIGFQKDDKGILFAATEEAKEVHIKLDESIMGKEMVFNFYLDANEAKMFRLTRKNPPYLP